MTALQFLVDDGYLVPERTFVSLPRVELKHPNSEHGSPVLLCPYCSCADETGAFGSVMWIHGGHEIAGPDLPFGTKVQCFNHLFELVDIGDPERFAKFVRYIDDDDMEDL